MSLFRTFCCLTLSGVVSLASGVATAQQIRSEAPPPPRLEKLEEGDAPAVTIPGKETDKSITETRDNGRVTSVKVTTGGSTYYVKPNDPKGSALPGDAQSTSNQPAQWQVMQFNTDPRVKEQKPEPNTAPQPAQPAATPAAAPAPASGR